MAAKAKTLTVGELIERLSKLDQSLPVVMEGCDCDGSCADVVVKKYSDGPAAYLERPNP